MEHSSAIISRDFTTRSSCADLATTPKEIRSLPLIASTLTAPTIPKANANSAIKKTITEKRIKTENKHENQIHSKTQPPKY